MVQWLRICASTAGGMGSIPRQEAKILHATRCSQKNKECQRDAGCKISRWVRIGLTEETLSQGCEGSALGDEHPKPREQQGKGLGWEWPWRVERQQGATCLNHVSEGSRAGSCWPGGLLERFKFLLWKKHCGCEPWNDKI